MSLMNKFESVRGQLEDALEASQYLKDDSVAQVLDDILLRQKFWAEDVGFENDPYSSISKEPSDAIETMRHLTAMKTLLLEIKMAFSLLQKSPNKINNLIEKAHELQLVNDRLCNSEEIFDILEGFEELEAGLNGRKKPPELSSMPDEAPASRSTLQSPVPIEKLAVTEENLSFEASTAMMRDQPSKLNSVGHVQITEPPEMRISRIVEKVSSLTKMVLELEKIPEDIQSGFKIEQYRLGLSLESMVLHAKANEGLKEVNYWKTFEDNLLSIILRLEDLRDSHIKKDETPSGITPLLSKSAEKTSWVLRSKARLDSLGGILNSLRHGNDCLDTLSVALQQDSLRGNLKAHFSTRLARNFEQATQMQRAAALLGHVDIEHMAQAMKIVNNADEEQPPPYSAQHPERDLFIENTKINLPAAEAPRVETRTITEYNGNHIIIDWHYHDYRDSWREMNAAVFRHRTESLAKLLNYDLQSMGLSVLRCVGYVEIEPGLTGYGFRLPQGVSPKVNPVTLRDLFRQDSSRKVFNLPDLGERFDLAKALVNTMFKIQTIGWVHRNLLPRNILFWPYEDDSQRCEYRKPYLVGFDIAGPSRPGEFSERPESLIDDDYYRHRDYQQIGGRQLVYDVYSLGILLFEIGSWRPIASFFEKGRRGNPFDSRLAPDILNDVAKTLKRLVGSRYVEAALACLDGSLEDLWNESEGVDGQRENHLKYPEIINEWHFCPEYPIAFGIDQEHLSLGYDDWARHINARAYEQPISTLRSQCPSSVEHILGTHRDELEGGRGHGHFS